MSKIVASSGNVFADLGIADHDTHQLKAQMVIAIADILERKKLTQIDAAALMGLPQPKLSRLLRGQFRGVSEAKLMDCLARLGNDIRIEVRPLRKVTKRPGRVEFAYA